MVTDWALLEGIGLCIRHNLVGDGGAGNVPALVPDSIGRVLKSPALALNQGR